MKEIYIIGTSGFASEVTEYILDNGDYNIKGYFDINEIEYKKYQYKPHYICNFYQYYSLLIYRNPFPLILHKGQHSYYQCALFEAPN